MSAHASSSATSPLDVSPELLESARDVLRTNDTGAHTVPARGLYPHQWNWDSALIALGWSTFDGDRAWRELETLMAAQDALGFVAHIAFDREPQPYVPGPDWWGLRKGGDGRHVSGITQPAVAATCVRRVFERAPDEARVRPLLGRLMAWHTWLLADRDPDGLGEPVVIHPWESGRDNAVEWDAALEASPVTDTEFERADTDFVDETQRPTKEHYRHYLGLVEWCRERGWSQRELAAECPFRVLDPGFSALLAQACDDLAWLADELGDVEIAERSWHQAQGLAATLSARADSDGNVWAIDVAAGRKEVQRVSCGNALVAAAPGIAPRVVARARDLVIDGALSSDVGVLSTARDDEAFAPGNYWRGPAWANITWLTALALERAGDPTAATTLHQRLAHFADHAGIREYAHAETGEGLGAKDFSWTAALLLDIAYRA